MHHTQFPISDAPPSSGDTSFHRAVWDLALRRDPRYFAAPQIFLGLLGDLQAAIFLSRCVYWASRSQQPDHSFYKTAAEWKEELGLSRRDLERCRKVCAKYLRTERRSDRRGRTVTYYQLDHQALWTDILYYGSGRSEKDPLGSAGDSLEPSGMTAQNEPLPAPNCTERAKTVVQNEHLHLLEMNNGNAGALKELTNKTTKPTNKGEGGEATGLPIKTASRSPTCALPPSPSAGYSAWAGQEPARTSAVLFEPAEQLYLKVRPEHVALPRTDQSTDAIEILTRYLQKHNGDFEAAATDLRPFAQEADRRGIRQTNLCWLTEWAAAGQIPPTTPNTGRYKREMARSLNPTPPPPPPAQPLPRYEYDPNNLPWEWKPRIYDEIVEYMKQTFPNTWRHMLQEEGAEHLLQTVSKRLPADLAVGATLRVEFDDSEVLAGEVSEIRHSTLFPQYITHLVIGGEEVDALDLVYAKDIRGGE